MTNISKTHKHHLAIINCDTPLSVAIIKYALCHMLCGFCYGDGVGGVVGGKVGLGISKNRNWYLCYRQYRQQS